MVNVYKAVESCIKKKKRAQKEYDRKNGKGRVVNWQ